MGRGRFYQINQYIKAEKVRVIGKDDQQIGVMPTAEALQQAIKQRLDLVEVAPKAEPPVCKIINFKKFIYQERKKRQVDQRRKRSPGLKQIRLKLFIDSHDLKRIIKKVEGFLKSGDKVKFTVLFRGREITKKELGFELIKTIKERLTEVAKLTQAPKLKGRILEMTLGPKQKNKHAKNQN